MDRFGPLAWGGGGGSARTDRASTGAKQQYSAKLNKCRMLNEAQRRGFSCHHTSERSIQSMLRTPAKLQAVYPANRQGQGWLAAGLSPKAAKRSASVPSH
jgi:hypothetical protein